MVQLEADNISWWSFQKLFVSPCDFGPFLLFQLSLGSAALAMLLSDACFLFLLPFCIAALPLLGF